MAFTLQNSFESGSDGAALSAANSGGGGSNAFDSIDTAGGGPAPVYDNAQAMHGALSALVANKCDFGWDSSIPSSQKTIYGRTYFRFSGTLAVTQPIVQGMVQSAAVQLFYIRLTTNSKINLVVGTGTSTASSTLSANTWYRIEWKMVLVTSGTSTLDGTVYLGDSTSALSTMSQATGSASGSDTEIDGIYFGATSALGVNLWMDDVQINSTGYPGPASNLVSGAGAGAVTFTGAATGHITGYGTAAGTVSFTGAAAGGTTGVFSNTAEGGTNGTVVTTGNSGGTSGNAWSTVAAVSGTAPIFSVSGALSGIGSLGYQIGSTATIGGSLAWSVTAVSDGYGRVYVNSPGSGLFNIIGSLGGVNKWTIQIGAVQITSTNGGTTPFSGGSTARIQWHHNSSNQLVVTVWKSTGAGVGANGAPDATLTSSSATNSNIDKITITGETTGNPTGNQYVDDIVAFATSATGPTGYTPAGTATGTVTFTGSATGHITQHGSAAGAITVTGAATGVVPFYKSNDFDTGQSSGTAITTGNSSAAGDTAFDSTVGTTVYDNSVAHSGTLSMKTNTAAASQVNFSSALTSIWGRTYMWFPSQPGSTVRIVQLDGDVDVDLLRITAQAHFTINVNGTGGVTSTSSVPTGAWMRLEWHGTVNGATSTIECKIFLSPEATTPDETISTSVAATDASLVKTRAGNGGISSTVLNYDDFAVSNQGYIGPNVTTISGTAIGTVSFTGVAGSHITEHGIAAASVSFIGSAAGHITEHGAATGVVSFTGLAAGAAHDHLFTGAATGSITFTGSAAGHITQRGAATGNVAFTGAAGSHITEHGGATGVVSFAGSALGHITAYGTAAAAIAVTGNAKATGNYFQDFEFSTSASDFGDIQVGLAAVATDQAYHGVQSLKFHQVGISNALRHTFHSTGMQHVLRFWLRWHTLPNAANEQLLRIDDNSGNSMAVLALRSADGKLQVAVGGGAQSISPTAPTVDTWHSIDILFDSSGTTWTGEWAIDGVAIATNATATGQVATNSAQGRWSAAGANSFDWWIDYYQESVNAAQYPLRDPSTTFSDSDSGSGVDGSPLLPSPTLFPGPTVFPSYGTGVDAYYPQVDSASGADASTEYATLPRTESVTGSDTSLIFKPTPNGVDSGSGADVSTVTVTGLSRTDSATGSEVSGIIITGAPSTFDSATGVDTSIEHAVAPSSNETGVGVDSSSLSISTEHEVSTLQVSEVRVDSSAGVDGSGLGVGNVTVNATDSGIGTDTSLPSTKKSDTDSGIGSDLSVQAFKYARTDSASGTDGEATARRMADFASGTDSSTLLQSNGNKSLTAFEFGTVGDVSIEAAHITGTPTTGLATDSRLYKATLRPTDSATGVDAHTFFHFILATRTDTGHGVDDSVSRTFRTDAGTGSETHTLHAVFSRTDVGSGSDKGLLTGAPYTTVIKIPALTEFDYAFPIRASVTAANKPVKIATIVEEDTALSITPVTDFEPEAWYEEGREELAGV